MRGLSSLLLHATGSDLTAQTPTDLVPTPSGRPVGHHVGLLACHGQVSILTPARQDIEWQACPGLSSLLLHATGSVLTAQTPTDLVSTPSGRPVGHHAGFLACHGQVSILTQARQDIEWQACQRAVQPVAARHRVCSDRADTY